MILSVISSALALISLGVNLWQFVAAWLFPLHRWKTESKELPGVTILKPLKGRDQRSRANLRSWFTLRYGGPLQVVFGVRDPKDPILDVVRELIAEFPQIRAQWLVCPEQLGPNAKVNTLAQLEPLIEHDLVLVSDADVRVPYHFLSAAVIPLIDPEVGLVTAFYRMENPSNFATCWEAVAVNSDFWSQVLQSRHLSRMNFALGAVMLMRRKHLRDIGGFAQLVDYLADDYQIGNRIAGLGVRIEICPVVVECCEPPGRWRSIWAHQVRWARTIRVCQPVSFFASAISSLSVWFSVWYVFGELTWPWLLGAIVLRIAMAWTLAWRLELDALRHGRPWLLGLMSPIKDFLGLGVWAVAFVGNRVAWRGQSFKVRRDGKLVPITPG